MHIGFVGLGHMGKPMAINLCNKAFSLTVYDLVPEAVTELVALGASKAITLEGLADCDVIITMLPQGDHVKSVCLGEHGLFNLVKPGALFIDCSSIAVDTSRSLALAALEKGFHYLDAPVSGGVTGAQNGTLTFMVGGDESDFANALVLFNAMGKNIFHAGMQGNGQAAKICNNMLLGISMIGTSEAFALAEKLGLTAQTFFDIASVSSGQCWSMSHYCPVPGPVPTSPANHDYAAGFSAAMMLKDLRLSQAAATTVGANTPLAATATALYTALEERGLSQADFSAIIKLFQ